MIFNTLTWLSGLLALGVLVSVFAIKRIWRIRVWIKMSPKKGEPMKDVAYLMLDGDGTAGEVHLPGSGTRAAIGRIIVDDQSKQDVGLVEIVTTDVEDETENPRYIQCGYLLYDTETSVDEYGYVYKHIKGKKKKEMVGYCARPSDPDTPTIRGERSWKTLWLVCRLNAYSGKPKQKNEKGKSDEKQKTDTAEAVQVSEVTHTSESVKVDGTETPAEVVSPQKKDKKEKKENEKMPVAKCRFYGYHSSKKAPLPAEARACAYALLSRSFQRRNYSEYYKDKPYGWRDTALLTTLVYSVLFLLLYIVNTGVLQMPLLGNDLRAVFLLIAAYYVLWALIRFIKIEFIESSNSFQPRLDLLNKNLGHNFMNGAIVTLSAIAVYFTFGYYDYDFLPLLWAIGYGVSVNMTLKGANRRWLISSSYNDTDPNEEENEEQDDTEIENPPGDIARSYEWDLDATYSARQFHGDLMLYFTATEMTDLRQSNPFFAQRKDKSDKDYILEMFEFLKDHRVFLLRVRYIAQYIKNTVRKQNMTPLDKIQFTLDFIQEPNIQFVNNKDCKVVNYYEDYIRYTDETLYDKEGDSKSKSLLAAMLFHVMGYNVLYLMSRRFQHAAIAIEVNLKDLADGWYGSDKKLDDITITMNGKRYIYCETTGDRFSIGSTIQGMSIDDFEEKILLPLTEDTDESGDEEGEDSIIYNWDLDSVLGNKLHGNITLNFSIEEMEELRNENPFKTFGNGSPDYETSVHSIFDYLLEDPDRMEHVRAIADYMRKSIADAKYPEIDLIQFALDFVQEPNIVYCTDENSAAIDSSDEYMRFPDEVLYDKEGDCDCKSSLMAALFHELGYNVVFMLSQKKQHAAIGIECKDEWLEALKPENPEQVVREHNGKRYLYCETTGDNFKIGHIGENDSVQNYETIIEIPA